VRIRRANDLGVRPRGRYVLYWMIGSRRTTWNHALDHAIASARVQGVPLIVLEPLRVGYPWACDRFHAFVVQGMAANQQAFAKAGVTYFPYVETEAGAGAGLLEGLAAHAKLVITDEQPGFFQPRMVAAAAAKLDVRLDVVDSCGVLPLRAFDRAFPTASSFRRQMQRYLASHMFAPAAAIPLTRLPREVRDGELPPAILRRWKPATAELLGGSPEALAALPIDHAIAPVAYRGGAIAAAKQFAVFLRSGLARYGEERSDPDAECASELSPYLHFGHIAAEEIVATILDRAGWDPTRMVGAQPTGSREGWWGVEPNTESFLDEIITWRELGYGFCYHRADYGQWSALPDWARATLDKHAKDPRPETYTRAELEAARTADPIWNAAQRQLVAEGRIQNYLRMLWGKKILEWSPSPKAALATLIELNNKYAVDGRDPNSYSGILWTLGLFDRAWGPERPIFGTIRYMTSASTKRKLKLKAYLARWATSTPG
jgi:deoxyribodipyrimidine photo-lyase